MHRLHTHTLIRQPRLTRTLPPLLLALWLLGAAACSPRAGVTEDGDVVADGELSDFAAAEVVADIELDGTDSLTDVVDAPDAPDAKDVKPFDPYDNGDAPYWIAEDIDTAGLGELTASVFCYNLYMKIKPNDPPHDPSCTTACPAPYPCTCGTCPWIETPLMKVARDGAQALWTGEEVLVFGGATAAGPGGEFTTTFSAERWNPSLDKGFEFINLPFSATELADLGTAVKVFWTGSAALVITEAHQFLFDPKTNVVTLLPLAPALMGNPGAMVWTGDRLFWWGWDRATAAPGIATARLIAWQADTGWTDVPYPAEFLKPSPAEPDCLAMLDGEVYVFDLQTPVQPASGLDPAKPLMLRFSPLKNVWEALPQTMPPAVRCNHSLGNTLFHAFPDGIAFIPAVGYTWKGKKLPVVGEVWWKATGKGTPMKALPIT